MLFYPQNSACNVFSPDLNYLNGMIKKNKKQQRRSAHSIGETIKIRYRNINHDT